MNPLYQLADFCGIETSFEDGIGTQYKLATDCAVSMLRALGIPADDNEDHCLELLRSAKAELFNQLVEPVCVIWEDNPVEVPIRIRPRDTDQVLECCITLESSEQREWKIKLSELSSPERPSSRTFPDNLSKSLPISPRPPSGYHRLRLSLSGRNHEASLLCAPRCTYACPTPFDRTWGIFSPLYSLRTERNWGAGDFTDLKELSDWTRGLGGNMVGTLPLFASCFTGPVADFSPYLPISRLFWNDFYIDPRQSPEWEISSEANALANSKALQSKVDNLRQNKKVDYAAIYQLKAQLFAALAKTFFSKGRDKEDGFQKFLSSRPHLGQYAKFRAVYDHRQTPWPTWPKTLQNGDIQPEDYPLEREQVHLYVQWLATKQLAQAGKSLYLDLPLGIHPQGFDTWSNRTLFLEGVAAGAPPDKAFPEGQNWTFPPIHPQKLRQSGYRYFIETLRNVMGASSIVRIDHIMGLHRMYCIPQGDNVSHGTYLRYPADELYAILVLESHRNRTEVIGEDLGTVPAYVRKSMHQHGISRSFVLWFEINPGEPGSLKKIPANCLAQLNT
ncbi:MAG: 4-alpha-glucanotransferase, partial [Deltaproteobacteria bacterium]|nr:4-alpha-glucanotransferase [Deltaproteobacteria bacterium]